MASQFIVGDYVERTSSAGVDPSFQARTKAVVIDAPKGNVVRVITHKGHVYHWSVDILKHADNPIHDGPFQFGERVVRANTRNGNKARIGQVATVIQIKGSIRVVYPGSKHFSEGNDRYGEGWASVDIVRPPNISTTSNPEHSFQVGDTGLTRDGRPYVIVDANGDIFDVSIDGNLYARHCHQDGRTSWIREEQPEDLTTTCIPFKPGDRVRVTRVAKGYERNWKNVWGASMNTAVDKIFTVASVSTSKRGVSFKERCSFFPEFVLEPVTGTTDCTTSSNNTIHVTYNPKETPMLKIEDRIYINGSNAADYNDELLIETIQTTEKEIAKLNAIETKSGKIKARVAELEAGAKRLAQILDDRDAK